MAVPDVEGAKGRIRFVRRGPIDAGPLAALFREAWGVPKREYDKVLARSFTWICAFSGNDLVGFVNVAWDGGVHFFLLDTTVHPRWRGKGIGRRLVEEALEACRGRGEWLHVDADAELMAGLYLTSGFTATPAGLVNLTRSSRQGGTP